MTELERFYAEIGSDARPVLERFGRDPERTKRFLRGFVADGSFEALTEALKGNKAEAAFRAAHTLKGICLNLGFDRLFERASLVTERLRGGNLEGAKEGFPELKKEYNRTADAVHAFLIH